MRTRVSGSRTAVAALTAALLAGALAARAQITPFDFTGHWTGSATGGNGQVVTLAADFTAGTVPRTFTGTATLTIQGQDIQCPVSGRQKRHDKVKARVAPCAIGSILLRGKLDPTAQTITGHYLNVRRGKAHTGPFMLTKEA